MPNMSVCKHPQVRVIAREEEIEYVECLQYGEVFDSQEFQDMAAEGSLTEGSLTEGSLTEGSPVPGADADSEPPKA